MRIQDTRMVQPSWLASTVAHANAIQPKKASVRFGGEALSISPLTNTFNTPFNWLWAQAQFLLRWQQVGGKPINQRVYRQKRRQWHARVMQQIHSADQQHWEHVAKSQPLKQIGYQYEKGIPPSLVWVQPNPVAGGLPIRQNTNGLIAKIFIDVLSDTRRLPPAKTVEEGAAILHELRQGLTDLAMTKALAMPGVKPRSGGWYRQLWRHYFPELRPRCEAIREPFAYRLQGLAPGIFSVASVKNKLYSMIQIHHLIFIADNGAMMITGSPSPAKLVEMIKDDPRAQRAIDTQKPLTKEGWGFLPVPFKATRLGLMGTLELLQQQADKKITYRSQNDWGDAETILRDIPFDLPRHIKAGRLPILMNRPGSNKQTVREYAFSEPART